MPIIIKFFIIMKGYDTSSLIVGLQAITESYEEIFIFRGIKDLENAQIEQQDKLNINSKHDYCYR